MTDINLDRRRFVGGLIAAALPLSALRAADAERLKLDDPAAQALGYVETASAAAKDPVFKAGAHCGNCVLYTKAQEKGGYAPCGAFGGKAVASAGWCKAWTVAG